MNNFHVYEAIGRGKHSTVYKGRKKKSIEYFAVKSVDKSQRSKVLNEVRMLHSLDHANVLKFYSWYETSAHFWLILEYCVGGDLKGLLEQDKKLPENSIHDLAYDLVKALQFLHSQGIIYCDLKPSNVLLDESGCMKLCDFGLARRLKDIEKTDPGDVPQPMRGTPCYMAPELFQEGGVHSYASDFWALGCVLYECYAGRPPFVGNEFTQLVKSIISDPAPPLPDNPSRSFQNLINCLLMKDPAERLQWSELCEHNFWRSRMSIIPLPPQPAFDNMIELSSTPYLVERNGDKPFRQSTPPKPRDGLRKKDENSAKVFSTPVKNVQSGKKNNTKPSCKADGLKGVNILRMSRIAKKNLQRERDKENYRRHPTEASENETEVKIENNDMELDFGENPEGDAPDDNDGSDNTGSTEDEKPSTQGTDGNGENCMINQMDMLTDEGPVKAEAMIKTEQNCSENLDVVATPPSICMRKAQRAKATSGATTGSEPSDISAAFWHPTDLAVKPVMPSRKGDKAVETVPMLPFEALPAVEYIKLPREQMNALNSQILQSLSGTFQVSEKQNIIKYLEMISINSDAANIITNGPIMLLLIKMLRLSKTSVLRVQIASLMGLLIRYSTVLDAELAGSGIFNALSDGLRDRHDKLRRFCMATLGELLFYISTQSDQDTKEINAQESPLKDNRATASWQVPSSVIALVSSILRKGEDDLAQLYALRTIDNICSQGTDWTSRFASQDVIGHLCYIYRATGKQENTRLIAGSCLARLARFSSSCARDDFQMTLLRVLEAATEEPSVILNEHRIFTSRILPSLSVLYKGNKDGDARFLCLKILSDVMIVIFSDSSLTSNEQTVSDLRMISQKYFLPMYPSFAEDEDPIPIYAQKLLVMLMEHDYVKVSDILNEATVSRCFEFLLGDLSNANVSNIKLCFALASAPDMDTDILSQLQVVRRIGNLLELVTAKDMDDFLEPTLELCRAFISRGIGSDKIMSLSKEPALLVDSAFSMSIAVDQQSCVMDICDFGGNMGIFVDLVGSSDSQISDLASDCLVLLLKAAPREATVGLLTNLPKLSIVLDLLKHGTSLRLTRLLYCLAFSCRQYLAQGMIVSISLSALMRVEALVSTFKGSHDGRLADAASYLGAELQRLPRCG
uniref:Protein kinase domain-containing protein n=1 Tax=Leersia perrieri TaxID=77586 RepID=A0A0D9UZ90_9ORYZ